MLKSGGFSFKHGDIMLIPWYEPFLWGFYYINMKRFILEGDVQAAIEKRSLLGLFITALAFSLFSGSSGRLLLASFVSTAILLIMFHDPLDLYFVAYALGLGFVVELLGVSSGL